MWNIALESLICIVSSFVYYSNIFSLMDYKKQYC